METELQVGGEWVDVSDHVEVERKLLTTIRKAVLRAGGDVRAVVDRDVAVVDTDEPADWFEWDDDGPAAGRGMTD